MHSLATLSSKMMLPNESDFVKLDDAASNVRVPSRERVFPCE